MKVHLNDIIDELFKEEDWGVTYDQFKKICRHPFTYISQMMSDGSPKKIILKYLGAFEPKDYMFEKFVKHRIKKIRGGNKYYVEYRLHLIEKIINNFNEELKGQYQRELRDALEENHNINGRDIPGAGD